MPPVRSHAADPPHTVTGEPPGGLRCAAALPAPERTTNPGGENLTVVMDIGGTHVTAARVDLESRSLVRAESFREPLNGDGTAAEILAALVRCAQRLPGSGVRRWAVALPSPFDYERGVGRYERVGKFDSLHGVDLRAALTERLPGAREMAFHNDADAFVRGEWWTGAARGYRSAAGITLGTDRERAEQRRTKG